MVVLSYAVAHRTNAHLCRGRAGQSLSDGHELDELLLREPLRLIHEPLVQQSNVGRRATVGYHTKRKELPKHLRERKKMKPGAQAVCCDAVRPWPFKVRLRGR